LYVTLCGILLVVTGYLLLMVMTGAGSGWDYRVYIGAVDAFLHGQDPYILSNIQQYVGGDLGFGQPPHTLIFYWFIALFQSIGVYYLFEILVMIVSAWLIIRTTPEKPHYLFLTTLLLTGFFSTFWLFLTGNTQFVFLLLISLMMYLLVQEKYTISAVIMGIMGSFSLLPILFSAFFIFVKGTLLERFRLFCIACGTFGAILLATFIINPQLMRSYIFTLTDPATSAPLYSGGGMDQPTWYLMLKYIGEGIHPAVGFLLIAIYVCLVIILAYYFIIKNQNDVLKVYSIGFLSLFMLYPRIKPYIFVMVVAPLYFLMKDYDYKIKLLVFLVISLFPMFVYLNYWINPKLVPNIVNLYSQTMSLIFVFGFITLYDLYKSRNSESPN
jgi:hypothetical protein